MNDHNVSITGLTRQYPEFRYSTNELINAMENKLTEQVKENILQLGVEHRYFIRSFDHYINKSGEPIK